MVRQTTDKDAWLQRMRLREEDWARLRAADNERIKCKVAVHGAVASDDPGVNWRVDAMRHQVRGDSPIPLLVARYGALDSGACLSCGETLPDEFDYVCPLCLRAKKVVLDDLCRSEGRGIAIGERR